MYSLIPYLPLCLVFVGGKFPVHACVYWISFIHRHKVFRYSIIYTKFLHCILIGIHHVKLNVTIYTGIDTMISLHEFLLLLIVIVNWRWILLLLLLIYRIFSEYIVLRNSLVFWFGSFSHCTLIIYKCRMLFWYIIAIKHLDQLLNYTN